MATRIVVARAGNYYDDFLAWARAHGVSIDTYPVPATRVEQVDWSDAGLFISWVPDPPKRRAWHMYKSVQGLENEARRRGIPVWNPVDACEAIDKASVATRLRIAGFRAPWTVRKPTRENLRYLELPVVVRENAVHGGLMELARTAADREAIELANYAEPIAVEYIDTRGQDGRYRKWRYVVAGDRGAARHLIVSDQWVVRPPDRVENASTRAEEIAYLSRPDPHHDELVAAARAVHLDFVAWDYAYDQTGCMVIWEANPVPCLWDPVHKPSHALSLRPYVERIYQAMLAAYQERAGA